MGDHPSYNTTVVNGVIKEAVNRPGWTQRRLAAALGVRPQTVNKWVKGENTVPPHRWADIEKALGLTPRTFVRLVMGDDTDQLGLPNASEELEMEDLRVAFDGVLMRLAVVEAKLLQLMDHLDVPKPGTDQAATPSTRAATRQLRAP